MRPVLNDENIHESIRERVTTSRVDIVNEVMAEIAKNDLVIVGMAMNPHCKKARKLAANRPHKYLEYGSYTSEWRRRTALKMWSGWPTFPMVFVKGQLVGGASEFKALSESGELDTLLA